MHIVVGVDEAGRGPLAGPVAVGAVAVPAGFDVAKEFPGLADSKQLAEEKREALYAMLKARQKNGDVRFVVRFASAPVIDAAGVTEAVRRCVFRSVRTVAPAPEGTKVYLDGLLKAPPEYVQETIVKGDALIPVISLASVAAKVERDRLMKRLSARYPQYGFDLHKGYGTKKHIDAIRTFGRCEIHRRSFCRNIPIDTPLVRGVELTLS